MPEQIGLDKTDARRDYPSLEGKTNKSINDKINIGRLKLKFDNTKHFGICYTLKCNVECPHCADECGPHRTEKMDPDDIKFIIKNVAMTGFESIELYGGEPFLDFNQLSDIIRYCKQWGIRPLIYTNGYWGKNVDSAKEKLEILKECGLDALAVSIDSHHQKSILIDYPLNVLRIAERLDIDNFCVFCPSMDAQEDDSIIDIVKKVTKHIYISPVFNEGRAKKRVMDSKPLNQLDACQWQIRTSTPLGNVFACCNPLNSISEKEKTIFYLGNCLKDNIREALTNSNYYRLLSFFHDADSDIYYKRIFADKLDKKYRGICDFCLDAMTDQKVIDKITLYNPKD